jgi:predicted MFS family arabinose efflux permease
VSLPAARRGAPTIALFAARVVYALNWYNVGAVLPLIGRGLSAGPVELGIVLGAFLAGVGIFQLPAGLASLRWGPRRVSLAGLTLLGGAGLVSSLAPTWPTLAGLRFVAGVGAAFFFSPALSLIASYYPAGRRGPVIGLFNGGFSVGGAAGLLLGAAIGEAWGWPAALASGGAAMLVATAICWGTLPRTEPEGPPPDRGAMGRSARSVLLSRSVWALALALTGFWGAIYIVAQYFVSFVDTVHSSWGPGVAAGLAGMVVLLSFPAGPLGGWIAERGADRRFLLGAFALVGGGLAIGVPFLGLVPLTADLIVLGVVDGIVFAILYLIPTYLPETLGEGLALGVAALNSIQVVLGSLMAVAFGALVAFQGYTVAWVAAGVVTVAPLPLLWLVRPNRAGSPAWAEERG